MIEENKMKSSCRRYLGPYALLMILVSGWSNGAQAALVQYTYTGSAFDATDDVLGTGEPYEVGVDRITGYFVIDDADMISVGFPGGPTNVNSDVVSWSFDDGASGAPFPSNIDDANGTLFAFAFYTDAGGNILGWKINVYVSSSLRWMNSCFDAPSCGDSDDVMNRAPTPQYTASSSLPGVWSGPSAVVPVPAAAWLFGSALGIIGWLRRRSA